MSDNQYADLLDDNNDDLEIQTQEPENGPKALREALKKETQKRKELEAQLAEREAKERESEVKSKLAAAGLPEGAAKFAATAEDIDAWIQENRGLFGVAGATPEPDVDQTAPVGQPSLSPEAIQQLQSTQVTPGHFEPGGNAVSAKLDEATSGATDLHDVISKVNAALRTAG